MKESVYNIYISGKEDDNIHLIYNAFKNTLISDNDNNVKRFISGCKGEIKLSSEYITKDEFEELISAGILVSDEIDEKQLVIDKNKKRLEILNNKYDHLSLVITPTLRCNFKCYYCFESTNIRKDEGTISLEVQNDIIDYITKSITEYHIKAIEITWYGGEPLIQQNIIFSMQQKINEICKLHNVKRGLLIVTNGLLCTPETCDQLCKLGIKKVQITIDGPEHIHNKRRLYPKDPTNNYNTILNNILHSNESMKFRIRINLDKTNNEFIYDLINDLIERKIWPYKKNVSVYTARVESASKTDLSKGEYAVLEDEVRRYLMNKYNEIKQTDKAKLNFLYPKAGGEVVCGYGVSRNSWIVSYNGDVFRCAESVGEKEHIVGTTKDLLKDFGQSIFEKIKIDINSFEKWGCFDCKYFPICGTTCPWDYLKSNEGRRCTEWKSLLEYRILKQYKSFLNEPEVFESVPFKVE